MGFEIFSHMGESHNIKTIVTINKYNSLTLNVGAIRTYKIREYHFVNVYYDEDTRKVGLKFLQDKEEHAFALTASKNQCTIYISFIGFLKYHNLELNKMRKYLVMKDGESGLFVFDINKPLKVLARKKKINQQREI